MQPAFISYLPLLRQCAPSLARLRSSRPSPSPTAPLLRGRSLSSRPHARVRLFPRHHAQAQLAPEAPDTPVRETPVPEAPAPSEVGALEPPDKAAELAEPAEPAELGTPAAVTAAVTAPRKLRLLWDSECPLCVREVSGLRARALAKFGDPPVEFVDVADPAYEPAENGGVGYARAMGRIHAVAADGEVVEGVEVFRRVYGALGLGWVYAPTRLPGVGWIVEQVYDVWAVNRLWITGRPALEDLVRAREEARAMRERGEGTCR